MTGLLAKLRIATLGNAHDLLDKVIDLNSPSALRQYVRDLEDSQTKLASELAVQRGTLVTLTREQKTLESEITSLKSIVTTLLKDPKNEALARTKAERIRAAQIEVTDKVQEVTDQANDVKQMSEALATLDSKHTEMLNQLHHLEHMDRTTKAKEQAAGAIKGAGSLIQGGADISVDDIAKKMQARADIADAKFDQAMNGIKTEPDPIKDAAVDDILSSLRPAETTTAKA